MKKVTMETLAQYLSDKTDDVAVAIREEVEAELAKSKAKADANKALYANIHDKVIKALTDASANVTAQEIANETGVARGKIVYGLTNYWMDEIGKDTTGKTTTYYLL